MKIITHFSLLGQIFHRTSFSLSNFVKNPRLTIDDLSARPQTPIPESPAKPFNISHSKSLASKSAANSAKLDLRTNEQNNLNLIFENLSSSLARKAVPVFRNKGLDPETQIQNAITFMKYLDHSLEKAAAMEVVVMVEKYCSRNERTLKETSSWPTLLDMKMQQSEKSSDAAEVLFKAMRDHLIHNLNFFSENIDANEKLIDSLFEILVEADPAYITIENFEHECVTLDEEERRQQVTGKMYFEASCEPKYFEKDNHLLPTAEERERTKYKSALEEAFQLKDRTKFSKLHLKKEEGGEEGRGEPKLKVASEKMVFHKKNVNKTMVSKQTEEEDLKCAYAYELPFNITKEEASELIHYIEASKGIKVDSFVLFPYKDFIERNHHEITYRIPDRFQEKNTHLQKVVKKMEIDELTKPNPHDKKKRFVERSKSKSKFDDVPLENEPCRMKSVTEALLHKIKKENYSKFNKSSMLIKFASRKDKEAILTQEARLYGLNYKGFKNIKFEEGFCKSTISLTGFPWGCGSKELERHLNKILEPERIPIRVEENCILTKNSIAIQFDYLSEAFLAIQKLNDTSFQNKQIKAHLTYGPVKIFNHQYNVSAEASYEKLKKKIQESAAYYEKQYEAEWAKSQ